MTLTSQALIPVEIDLGQLRADLLRMLISLHLAHNLPMPERIEMTSAGNDRAEHRYLTLTLDNDHADDVRRWAQVIGAEEPTSRPAQSGNARWTTVRAETGYRSEQDLDWHHIEIRSVCDYHQTPAQDPAPLAAAA